MTTTISVRPDTVIAAIDQKTGTLLLTRDGFNLLQQLNRVLTDVGSAVISQTIDNGDTTHAPAGNAVFDALALKYDTASLGANVGTFLGAPSSANLAAALTDETGTGLVVFNNTPTLITPVLGDATATSLTFGGSVLSTYAITSTTCTVAFATPGTSSFVYTVQTLNYVQIGSLIFFTIDLAFTPTLGTASGQFTVVVPWTAAQNCVYTVGEFGVNYVWTASRTMISGRQTSGATIITLAQQGTGVGTAIMSTASFTSGSAYTLRITGTAFV